VGFCSGPDDPRGVQSLGAGQPCLFIFAADLMTRGHTPPLWLVWWQNLRRALRGGLPSPLAAGCHAVGAGSSGSTQPQSSRWAAQCVRNLLEKGLSHSFSIRADYQCSDMLCLFRPRSHDYLMARIRGLDWRPVYSRQSCPLLILLMFSCIAGNGLYPHGYIATGRARQPWIMRGAPWKKAISATWLFPGVVVGRLYGGIFSPIRGGGLAVLYALILEVIICAGERFASSGYCVIDRPDYCCGVYLVGCRSRPSLTPFSFAGIPGAALGQ